ncbi:MAG: hypothetical protein M3460_03295 [Actinomycetota bacterium]|nr:hypothetical protein [Actinomycetota bacterium]
MALEPIILVASLVILGGLIGYRIGRWQLEARAKRQAAAQLSVYRQLHELQAARQMNYAASSNLGNSTSTPQRQAA